MIEAKPMTALTSSAEWIAAPAAERFPTFPVAWYLFGESRELRDGPVSKDLLGQRLVAFRTASGSVEDVRVLKSVNPLLDASAVRAVGQWRYRPATLNGRAVRVYLTVTVT